MSYCVNCGVELENSQGKCPLCDTVVQNPMEPYDPRAKKPYPPRTPEQNLTINRKYYVLLLSIAFLVPALICFVLDLLSGAIDWSLYPMGAILMVFVFFAVPGLVSKYRLYTSILADGAAICGYLKLVQWLGKGGIWFDSIVFPLLILAVMMTLAMAASIRQRLVAGLLVPAVALVLIGILAIVTELLIGSSVQHALRLTWSPFVLIPCFLVGLALFLVHMNQPLRSQLHRRLHI